MSFLAKNSFNFAYIFKTITTKWYYYVALAVCLVLIVSFLFIKKQPQRNKLNKTQKLVFVALFSAIATLVNIFDIKISDVLQISLLATVGFIAGYLLGGGCGFAVCFVGDLLGGIINPHGPYNPIIGIGSGLWGLIPGVAFSYFKGNDYVKTAISFILGFLIVSCGVNIFGMYLMYPKYYTISALIATLPVKFLVAGINCALCLALTNVFPKVLPKTVFCLEKKAKTSMN